MTVFIVAGEIIYDHSGTFPKLLRLSYPLVRCQHGGASLKFIAIAENVIVEIKTRIHIIIGIESYVPSLIFIFPNDGEH